MFLSWGFCAIPVLINKLDTHFYFKWPCLLIFSKTVFSKIVLAFCFCTWRLRDGRVKKFFNRELFSGWTLKRVRGALVHSSEICSVTNVERETRCARLCICDWTRLQSVSVCGSVHMCTHTHTCVRMGMCVHTQTSICASNTAGMWWHVPVQPP